MKKKELNKLYENFKFYKTVPEIGDYFGVISNDINSIIPDFSENGISFIGTVLNSEDTIPLLFKRIDEKTAVEVSTGIPVIFEICLGDEYNLINKDFIEDFHIYRQICLEISDCDYIIPNDEFKKAYASVIKNGSKELKKYLDSRLTKAYNLFENKVTNHLEESYLIAIVDNLIYDIENKYKVKSLTIQNDEQN